MQQMHERNDLVENLSGIGRVFCGGAAIGAARYSVRVSKTVAVVNGEETDLMTRIEGRVFGGDFDPRGREGSALTLELADGRRWDCLLKDTGGTLLNTGERGLYRP